MAKKNNKQERKPDLNEAENQAELEARIAEMMEIDRPKPVVKPISVAMHDDEDSTLKADAGGKKPLAIKVVDHNVAPDGVGDPEPEMVETEDVDESDPDVLAAIEEANQRLKAATAPDTSQTTEPEEAESEPDETTEDADTDEEALSAPLLDEAVVEPETNPKKIKVAEAEESSEAEPVEEQPESEPEIEDSSEPEASEEDEPEEPLPEIKLEKRAVIGISKAEEPNEADNGLEEAELATPTKPVEVEPVAPTPVKERPLKHLDSIIPKTKVEKNIDDPATEQAVDDIIAADSDLLLQIEDERLARQAKPAAKAKSDKKRVNLFKSKFFGWMLALLIVAAAVAAAIIPEIRYLALNKAGVRSAASLVIIDESTQQPLKGVKVSLGSTTVESDQEGKVALSGLELGPATLTLEKRAFAPINRQITVGWGSNPLGDFSMTPTGTQYRFMVVDYLSGKPLTKVQASSGEASSSSNEKGEIKLTIDQQDDTAREVGFKLEGYREESFRLNLDQKDELKLEMVADRKHVFITKRSGRFDVYKADVDGKNEKIVLPGTGSERDDMVLVSHPADEIAAAVSTKDNKRNSEGFLLSTLTLINLNEESTKSVTTSERVQIIDWVGSRLVYVQVKNGSNSESADRHQLLSYDYKTQEIKELARANYFNDVLVADGKVYYAPSSTNSGSTTSALYRVEADGSNNVTILNKEVWNIFRSNYGNLTLAAQQEWYSLKIGDIKPGQLSGEPADKLSRVYLLSSDGKRALWLDNRDGKGVLLAYSVEAAKDETIRTQAGLKQPIRWINNSVVIYRVGSETEVADYALSLDGGEPKKVSDVAGTSATDSWYYY